MFVTPLRFHLSLLFNLWWQWTVDGRRCFEPQTGGLFLGFLFLELERMRRTKDASIDLWKSQWLSRGWMKVLIGVFDQLAIWGVEFDLNTPPYPLSSSSILITQWEY